jgi:type II secretory pathway component PulF
MDDMQSWLICRVLPSTDENIRRNTSENDWFILHMMERRFFFFDYSFILLGAFALAFYIFWFSLYHGRDNPRDGDHIDE